MSGADRACLDLGGHVGDLVVAEGHVQQHRVARRVRIVVPGHVLGIAVRLGAVPERLDQRQRQRSLELVGVGRVEHLRERVEVDAAREQHAVAHARHDQRRAVEVGRHGGERAAEDAALAATRVEEPAGVDQRAAVELKRGVRCEALRVDHRASQEHEVDHRLLEAIRQRREARELLQDRDGVGDVPVGHADPVGGAEHDAVLRGDLAAADAVYLTGAAEQPVAVERHAPGAHGADRARDVADEVGSVHVARLAHRQAVGAQLEARSRWTARLVEIARHLHGALNAAADLGVLALLAAVVAAGRELGHPLDCEAG